MIEYGSPVPAGADSFAHQGFTPIDSLALKYTCQGPRYTSYPTAPHFSEGAPVQSYLDGLHDSKVQSVAPLSLYVHIPFCHDICYYCACNKIVTRNAETAVEYLAVLQREIELQSALAGKNRPVTQMHWGGGTPTYLDDAQLTQLMHLLASHFQLLDNDSREYSIEIDPRTVDVASIALLKGLGFNRISLGIQDFDPLVQKSVNRIQPYRQVARLVESIRSHGFKSLSFDLIYGLPHQDEDSIFQTLRKVLSLAPDRIACYNYAHLPERFSSQRAIDRLTLPQPIAKLRMHEILCSTLRAAGYVHIGMDHFVLPEDELAKAQQIGKLQRNFQGYSLNMASDLLGLGVSAISRMGDYYLQNERDVDAYSARLKAGELALVRGYRMTPEDKLRHFVIMNLACNLRLDFAECTARFGIDFHQHFSRQLAALDAMAADGLLRLDADSLRVTSQGRPFLRNICMVFDEFLGKASPTADPIRYSATL